MNDKTRLYGVDFEGTWYKGKRCATSLGPKGYTNHPETEIYLLSVYGEDLKWAGHPKDFDWSQIAGHDWVSHNAGFDYECYKSLGLANDTMPLRWHCSMDLVTHLRMGFSLKDAMQYLYGIEISKDVREDTNKKSEEEILSQGKEEIYEYALNDAKYCYKIWRDFSDQMSSKERSISIIARSMSSKGLPIDIDRAEEAKQIFSTELFEIRQRIPWADGVDEKGNSNSIMSPKAIAKECVKNDIPPPKTCAKDSIEFDNWLQKYEDRAPFVREVGRYRSVNRASTVVSTMIDRCVDGWTPYSLMYKGTKSNRFSGRGGFNVLNFPRDEVCGVNLRSLITAKEGHKLVISDQSQIESRLAFWFSGDEESCRLLGCKGADSYEVYSRTKLGYNDPRPIKEVSPEIRNMAKVLVLGGNYGGGEVMFKKAYRDTFGKDISRKEALAHRDTHRKLNPLIVEDWGTFDKMLNYEASNSGSKEIHISLPSGTVLSFYDLQYRDGGVVGRSNKSLPLNKLYGARIYNYCMQALGRDLLMESWIQALKKNINVIFHVYDEMIGHVPEDFDPQIMADCMTYKPDWLDGIELETETILVDSYTK